MKFNQYFKYVLAGVFFTLGVLAFLFLFAPRAHAQSGASLWKLSGTTLSPVNATWTLTVPGMNNTGGTRCVQVTSAGLLQVASDVCGSGGSGVSDGDYGDITVSGSNTVWTIDNDVVSNAKLRNSGALSVIGRSANSSGDPADISATATSDAVLRESGSTLGFGQIATGGIADQAVSFAKIQNITAGKLLGRTGSNGPMAEITIGSGLSLAANTLSASGIPTQITVADTTDATSFVGLFESATGDLGPKTDGGLLYDASNGTLSSTILNTPTLTLTGTGTLNGLDAIDGTGETTLEAALDIAGDVASTGLSSTVIQANAVALTTDTTGKYVASATSNGGLTMTGTEGGSLGVLLPSATDALSSTTSSGSGHELLSSGLTLLQGCSDGQILKWTESTDLWGCAADANSGSATAWDVIGDPSGDGSIAFAGTTQTITGNTNDVTAIGQDLLSLSFTNDAATDILSQRGIFMQNEASANGMEAFIALNNNDADDVVTDGIIMTSLAGAITDALDLSDADIVNAINAGANDLLGTNWSITGSSGLLQIPTLTFTGTGTINGLDAIDATSETTIETAIDTLANLTSIQGFTTTLADAGADAIIGWDDSANAYENLTQAEVLAVVGDSSDTAKGVVELATIAEVNTGTDATRAITPDGLAGSNAAIRYISYTLNATTALTTSEKGYKRIPAGMTGMNLISVTGSVGTGAAGSSSSGTPTFTVKNVTDGNQMLSTSLTIDASEYTSATAATPAVINASFDDVVTDDLIEVAVTTSGTGVTYAVITLGFQLP